MAHEFSIDVEFECSPEHLWPFIEEPDLQKQWMKGLIDNESTSTDPHRVGATFHMRIKEGRKIQDYDGEITAYDRPNHLAVKIFGGPFPQDMAVHADYKLEEVGSHRTVLHYSGHMDAPEKLPLFWKIMMPIGLKFARLQLKGFMRSLKALAEADAS